MSQTQHDRIDPLESFAAFRQSIQQAGDERDESVDKTMNDDLAVILGKVVIQTPLRQQRAGEHSRFGRADMMGSSTHASSITFV